MINDQTPITSEILLMNGWKLCCGDIYAITIGNDAIYINFKCGFACWLVVDSCNIGESFTTIGELKAIAKALYKVELKFE